MKRRRQTRKPSGMKPLTFIQRIAAFWEKVNRNGPVPPHHRRMSRCWIWAGGRSGEGYGQFRVDANLEGAHRVAFLLAHGRWPQPEIDHKCHVRACVRPNHLREATRSQNARNRALKICVRGHRLEDPNLYYYPGGKRRCMACVKAYSKKDLKGAPRSHKTNH